jgi:hypothetical protein
MNTQGVDERVILKWIFKVKSTRMLTGFTWLGRVVLWTLVNMYKLAFGYHKQKGVGEICRIAENLLNKQSAVHCKVLRCGAVRCTAS